MKSLPALFAAILLALSAALPAFAADTKSAAKAPSAADGKAAERLDINTANAKQLMTLDGIGEARAAAIIKGRPYKGKDELASKGIIPDAVYEKIKEQIIARQKAEKKK